jgi:hypothetical protein
VTVTFTDALLLGCLGLLLVSSWLLEFLGGLPLTKWVAYAFPVAGGVQLLFHPATLTGTGALFLGPGALLAGAGLGLWGLTAYQRPALRAAGRSREVNWRDVGAVSLWVAGAGGVMTAVHPLFGLSLGAGVAAWVWYVLRPEAREIHTHVAIEIRCDPATAFAFVANPRAGSHYIDDFEVIASSDEEIGVGYRYSWRKRMNDGYVFEDEDEIVEYQPGHRITERSLRHPPSSASCSVELAPSGTRVIFDYKGRLSVSQALLGLRQPVVIRLTAFRQRVFGRLKEVLEAPAA